MDKWRKLIPKSILDKYEFHNFNNALEILSQAYPDEYNEIMDALENMNLTCGDILKGGGNESTIPKNFLQSCVH
jgi:hypothetical protein